MLQIKMIEFLNFKHWTNGRDADVIKEFIKCFFQEYPENQTCNFCENPESILTKETCCTGCCKLK